MGASEETGLRDATVEDFVEDLYLTVQELMIRGVAQAAIKRHFNQSLKGKSPALIRGRTTAS